MKGLQKQFGLLTNIIGCVVSDIGGDIEVPYQLQCICARLSDVWPIACDLQLKLHLLRELGALRPCNLWVEVRVCIVEGDLRTRIRKTLAI